MTSLADLVRTRTGLDGEDLDWLRRLRDDWQIIADLSFADLVLWLPDRAGTGFWAAAQIRPTTGPTAYVDDVVGSFAARGERRVLDQARTRRRVVREGDPEWRDEVPVRVEAIPVVRADRVLAVVARHTNLLGVRTPSRLELAYLQTATDLTQMIAGGHFPPPRPVRGPGESPRVGDGLLRLDAAGVVGYASPNALSVYRRLGLSGDLVGLSLAQTTRALLPSERGLDEEAIGAVLGGRVHRDAEVAGRDVSVAVRSIPLRPEGEHIGTLVLVRDVTDLRRRDRELVTKDATIREIHHRVKNNLQTVAALLRLQSRRIEGPEARAALAEAGRRVTSIAVVHETLSQSAEEAVAFDDVADRLGAIVTDVGDLGAPVRYSRVGTFGTLSSQRAHALAMVLAEVLQNAAEHAYPAGGEGHAGHQGTEAGPVIVSARRTGPTVLEVAVEDRGRGLPDGFSLASSRGLGLSIVSTLVESELGGTLLVAPLEGGGTRVQWEVSTA